MVMTWLFESPVQVGLMGVALTLVLGVGWVQTGDRRLLFGTIAAALLGVALVGIERMVETDRETIELLLHRIAADVQSNDVERVIQHFHSSQTEALARARAEMPKYRFSQISVRQIHVIDVHAKNIPPVATCEFNVVAVGEYLEYPSERTVPRFVVLQLKMEDGTWKIADYMHDEPSRGFMERQER